MEGAKQTEISASGNLVRRFDGDRSKDLCGIPDGQSGAFIEFYESKLKDRSLRMYLAVETLKNQKGESDYGFSFSLLFFTGSGHLQERFLLGEATT